MGETIILGGKTRNLQVTLNVIGQLETEFNTSFLDGQMMKHLTSPRVLRRMMYLALKEAEEVDDPEVTEHNVGKWLTIAAVSGEVNPLLQAITTGFLGLQGSALAPFVPTPIEITRLAFNLVELEPGEVVLDIGCGRGDALIMAATEFKAGRLIGYELNEERARIASQKLAPLGVPFDIRLEDGNTVRPEDLAAADVVFLYLLTISNEKLRPMLEVGMKRGARLVSHDFPMSKWRTWRTQEMIITPGDRPHYLHAYLIGEHLTPASVSPRDLAKVVAAATAAGQPEGNVGLPSAAAFGTGGGISRS